MFEVLRPCHRGRGILILDIKSEFNDVIWLHDVVFSFGADLASGSCGRFRT